LNEELNPETDAPVSSSGGNRLVPSPGEKIVWLNLIDPSGVRGFVVRDTAFLRKPFPTAAAALDESFEPNARLPCLIDPGLFEVPLNPPNATDRPLAGAGAGGLPNENRWDCVYKDALVFSKSGPDDAATVGSDLAKLGIVPGVGPIGMEDRAAKAPEEGLFIAPKEKSGAVPAAGTGANESGMVRPEEKLGEVLAAGANAVGLEDERAKKSGAVPAAGTGANAVGMDETTFPGRPVVWRPAGGATVSNGCRVAEAGGE
jgi:hypothetical protein